MKIYAMTDVGRRREVNQDYVYVTDRPIGPFPNLLTVADGMGGHKAGDFASSYTVNVLKDELKKTPMDKPEEILRSVVSIANHKLIEAASRDIKLEGMGTTLVVLTIYKDEALAANIGDSRLYEISQKQIRQISEDHSLVAELVRKGELSATEARRHPDKNIITRALGIQDEAQIDLFPFRVETGNRYLLCSDGLTNMVEDTELCRLISQKKDISEIGAELILKANKNGGLDNIAVVLVEIDNSEVGL